MEEAKEARAAERSSRATTRCGAHQSAVTRCNQGTDPLTSACGHSSRPTSPFQIPASLSSSQLASRIAAPSRPDRLTDRRTRHEDEDRR